MRLRKFRTLSTSFHLVAPAGRGCLGGPYRTENSRPEATGPRGTGCDSSWPLRLEEIFRTVPSKDVCLRLRSMSILFALLVASSPATTPLDIAMFEIQSTVRGRAGDVKIEVRRGKTPESFTITPSGGKVTITGSDATGAMYGAFEFAERIRNEGDKAWTDPADAKPYLAQRGVNLFLTLPWDYKKNTTDNDVAALTDPTRWWFHDEKYWTTLLDLMAHSRLNWLDIHGAWDISVTDAPNLYAYFVTSPTFPKVGVPDEVKARDLAQLNHVIDMAHARGIKVSLMAYEARFHTPQNPNPPYKSTEENLYKYTREAVEKMIRGTPKLDSIGFRIGESGHGESFFKCYQEAVKNSGRDIPLITRTWVTRKQNVLKLARASKDFTAEIKYNGEQWAAPYIVAGGRMANWGSYSYEDYLSDSGNGRAAKMWPGNPTEEGSQWPAEPYKVVWQVRANGTHRIFPFYNPDWVRRSISCMKVGTASGYTVEGEDAYFPKSPLYYLANPADQYCDYIHQRDELYWMTWGRLGYDPKTPDSTFDAVVKQWFGSQGQKIADAWKAASTIVPLAYMAHAYGPDHRDHAPELETGGGEEDYIQDQPFDPLVIKPVLETFMPDGRANSGEVAESLDILQGKTIGGIFQGASYEGLLIDTAKLPEQSRGRFRELKSAITLLGNLSAYYSGSLGHAHSVAEVELDPYRNGDDWKHMYANYELSRYSEGAEAWRYLTESHEGSFYHPFTDRLRMHTNSFSWESELAAVKKNVAVATRPPKSPLSTALGLRETPSIQKLELMWHDAEGGIVCSIPSNGIRSAYLVFKPLPSSTFFHRQAMRTEGSQFVARIARPNCGVCIAAEAHIAAEALKGYATVPVPNFFAGQTPYLVVPAKPGPTPQIYATDEALGYLDPKILDPDKFGTMIVAPRGARFFGFSRAEKRKVLEGVRRGMKLLILQQNFQDRRYSLDFLPKPLVVEANPTPTAFDPDGQLGLSKLDSKEIQWQRFTPSAGWDVYGSGGLARLKLGKGEVWVTSARMMQRATDPKVVDDLQRMMRAFVTPKPAILLDAGTESAVYTTSFWPDLLNSLEIPFLTLGEAIAQEQQMNSFTPIPGPTLDDDVLNGNGAKMANTFLRNEVIRNAKRPTPANLTAFEAERKRRKKEVMMALGLDPMPKKTPLNARVTGHIQGNGYTIEKVVIESRPKFFVTMHVYVPDKASGRLPVVMNVNGHWAHKKDEDRIQLRCQFQALQGYIAVAVDSPGFSFEGNNLIERRAEGDHNDFKMVEGGTNATGYYTWDTMRALDYMATRPDTDMNHVGLTGASGGGLATLYIFAADDRYKAAVPVVYMASMELAPDNGCLCNHVPGTLQIGDRSDVIAIAAPKPVLLMGAEQDGEFPAAATVFTQKKMAETWALFGKADDTYVKIFPGGHDYNQGMREASIGFFNKYLKGTGDGTPVTQPSLTAIDPQDHQLIVLDPPEPDERTMRNLSAEYLDNSPIHVSASQAIAINGGLPAGGDLKYHEEGTGRRRTVTFESSPGLVTPAILFLPDGKDKGVRIVADDGGKMAAIAGRDPDAVTADGYAYLFVDVLGTGELATIELRYPTYLGQSVAFMGGWQLVRAAEAMHRYGSSISLLGRGALTSQAVMWAGLQSPHAFSQISGEDCLANWQAVFADGISDAAVQPRAHLCGSLSDLRKQVAHGEWKGRQ